MKSGAGFTLLEVIVALGVLMIALAAILSLAAGILRAAQSSRDEFVAANLAQEAIEMVRSARDSNWLGYPDERTRWLDGLPLNTDFRIQAFSPNGNSLISTISPTTPLLLSAGSNYYNYDTGAPTIFKRVVNITNNDPETADVKVTMTWQVGTVNHSLVAVDRLTNWR